MERRTKKIEEKRRAEYGQRCAPTVKRVQNDHRTRFVFGRAGFDDGAYQNLYHAAANAAEHRGNSESQKCVWQ